MKEWDSLRDLGQGNSLMALIFSGFDDTLLCKIWKPKKRREVCVNSHLLALRYKDAECTQSKT